ncbi:hypothetical protein A2U01_0097889, partial [Trifolium medium]|nr:hypothetical protein [Trifolium medium]
VILCHCLKAAIPAPWISHKQQPPINLPTSRPYHRRGLASAVS